jgi:hypothetical protein
MEEKKVLSEKEALLAYLEELCNFESSKLVGKCMKRFEIITDREILRKNIKELIYESFRDVKDILNAYGKGIETIQFQFKLGDK